MTWGLGFNADGRSKTNIPPKKMQSDFTTPPKGHTINYGMGGTKVIVGGITKFHYPFLGGITKFWSQILIPP